MEPIKIILNPVAGRGYGDRVEPEIRSLLEREGITYDLVRTERPGHATELAQEAAASGIEIVVAAGGDGTMHEVVNGLLAAAGEGEAGTMAALPIGSGSDFAHTIGTPFDLKDAVHRLMHGDVKVVDVGRVTVNDGPPQFFDNTLGVGFDGQVTLEALKFKRLRGMALYLPVVLKTILVSLKPPRATIEYDGQTLAQSSLMICVCNGPREGGGFFVAPDAVPDDGLFDLCMVAAVSKPRMFQLVPHFMKGTHVDRAPVNMARARHVVITSPDDMVAHVDGEILCTAGHRIECEIMPRRLRVLS
jgi:YegS/Rv2252/BmrU family lipid kinase